MVTLALVISIHPRRGKTLPDMSFSWDGIIEKSQRMNPTAIMTNKSKDMIFMNWDEKDFLIGNWQVNFSCLFRRMMLDMNRDFLALEKKFYCDPVWYIFFDDDFEEEDLPLMDYSIWVDGIGSVETGVMTDQCKLIGFHNLCELPHYCLTQGYSCLDDLLSQKRDFLYMLKAIKDKSDSDVIGDAVNFCALMLVDSFIGDSLGADNDDFARYQKEAKVLGVEIRDEIYRIRLFAPHFIFKVDLCLL